MKKIVGIITLLCSVLILHAQSDPHKDLYNNIVSRILQSQIASSSKTAFKKTGVAERLVSEKTTQNGGFFDSAIIWYSGTNGSEYDFNTMSYNYFHYSFGFLHLMMGDPTDLEAIQCDSLLYFQSGVPCPDNIRKHYNKGVLETYNNTYSCNIDEDDIYSYNSDGLMVTDTYSFTSTSFGSDTVVNYYSYNSDREEIEDSIVNYVYGILRPYQKHLYNYNSYGNMTEISNYTYINKPGIWIFTDRFKATYDFSGRVISIEQDTGVSLVPYEIDSFEYAASARWFIYSIHKEWNGSSWNKLSYIKKHVNAAGLPDSMLSYSYANTTTSYDSYILHWYHYTSQGNPLTDSSFFNSFAFNLINATQYYYDIFKTTEVRENNIRHAVHIYPNPATSTLYFNIVDVMPDDQLTVCVYNTIGQIIKKIVTPYVSGAGMINIADLYPGVYNLTIKGNKNAIVASCRFIKQ